MGQLMLNRLPDHEKLYEHILRRDPELDGVVYVGVKTTGIFCRPVCPARTPLSKNITFYGSPDEALAAGFRPCKRCRPLDDPNAPGVLIDKLLRLVELDADKSRFLRHVSHKLKTPLASLREGVSLLEDGVAGELSANQREVAKILRHNTGLLQGQIEDLLRFNTAAFDVVHLDPMYPDDGKAALPSKEMQILRDLTGGDADADALLAPARLAAKHRVVVKRPSKAPPLAGVEPSLRFEGTQLRFDVYLKV